MVACVEEWRGSSIVGDILCASANFDDWGVDDCERWSVKPC